MPCNIGKHNTTIPIQIQTLTFGWIEGRMLHPQRLRELAIESITPSYQCTVIQRPLWITPYQ
jgi:hypothetical protein